MASVKGACLGLGLWVGGLGLAQAGPTETVLAWVLSQVNDALPGELSYESLQASLGGPVILEGLRYEDDALLVAVGNLELAVDVAIFSRSVTLNRLQAFNVTVHLPPPSSEPPSEEPFVLSDISLPVSLDVQQVAVRQLSLLPYGASEPILVEQINLRARTVEDTLQVDTAQVQLPQGQANLSGSLTPVGQYPMDLQLNWEWQQAGVGSYAGEGTLSGDFSELRTLQTVSGDLQGELQASVADPLGSPRWSVNLNALMPDLGVVQQDFQGRDLRVQLQSEGDLSDYQASGELSTGALPEVGEILAALELSGGADTLRLPRLQLSASESPLALDVSADIDLSQQILNAQGHWQDLAWPLTGDPQVALPQGNLSLSGTLDDFRFSVASQVQGQAFGNLDFRAEGSGDQQRVILDSLRLSAPDNPLEVDLNGQLGLADLNFELRGAWSAIGLPLVGEPQIEITAGNLQAQGNPADYQAQLQTQLLGEAVGTLGVDLRLQGDDQAARIERLAITRPGDPLAMDLTGRFELATQTFEAELQVVDLPLPLVGEAALRIPSATLSASGTPADYQTRFDATLSGPAVGELQAQLEATGTDLALELQRLTLRRPDSDFAVVLGGRYRLRDQRVELQGDITALGLPLVGEPALEIPTGKFQLAGTPQDYQADLSLELRGAATGELQAILEASGDTERVQLQQLRLSRENTPLAMTLDGSFGFAEQAFMLGGEIRALPLPLAGEPAMTIPSGSLVASGTPNNYQARVDLALTGEATGELQALLQAQGDSEALQLETLRLSRPDSDFAISLDGGFRFAEQQFMLGGEIIALGLPLVGEPAITIPTGSFVASGTPADYQARVDLSLVGDATGELQALLQARGDDTALQLETLRLSRTGTELAVTLDGDFRYVDQVFTLAGDIAALPLPVTGEAALNIPQGQFIASGSPADYQARLDATVTGDTLGTLGATLALEGDAEQVQITDLGLRQPDGPLALGGQVGLQLADLQFDAELGWQALRWPLVGPDTQVSSPEGTLTASGDIHAYQAALQAGLVGPGGETLSLDMDLSGTSERVDIPRLTLTSPGDGPSLDVNAQVDLQPLAFNAQGQWQALVWPLQGAPQMASPQGSFEAAGDLDAYTFSLQTRVEGPALPVTDITLQGQGDGESLAGATLQANLLGGQVLAELVARWQPSVDWQATLRGESLDVGSFAPEFPGTVGFALDSEGRMDETLDAQVRILDLNGSLRQQPLGGGGELRVLGDVIRINDLQLQAGQAELQLNGEVAETLAVDWQLAANLAALLPDMQGRIQGQGQVSGNQQAPQVVAELRVNDLAAAGVVVNDLRLDAQVDVAGQSASSVDLQVVGVQAAGQILDQISLQGSGTPADHQLDLRAETAAYGDLGLVLRGRFEQAEPRWSGQLANLLLSETPAGNWQLASPAALSASASAASLGEACLSQSPAAICLEGAWGATEGASAALRLSELTTALVAQLLPENLQVNTALGGDIQARSDPAGEFAVTVDLSLDPGGVRTEVNGTPLEITLGGGQLQATANPRQAEANFQLDLDDLGGLRLVATVSELTTRPQVDARLQATIQDLSMAEIVVPQLTDVAGRIEADLTARGVPPVLDLGGSLGLVDASVDVPEVNLQLRELNLTASGVGSEGLDVDGSVRSGDGNMRFGGELAPLEGRVRLTIEGDRFQVINTPDIQAVASPNLQVAVSPEEVRVTGEVRIPEAYISPPTLQATGIQPASDVVIVRTRDGATVDLDRTAGAPVFARVNVILGDEVWVSAVGFEGRLEGSLEVEQRPGQVTRGSGSIAVASGQYRIAGQDIDIQRGRILFGGGPVSQPGLDLRVAREKDNIVAGAQVTGPVAEPELRFFSNPPMPDASILSYLMFGRAPDARASGENAMLLSAVTGGSSLVTQQIGQQVGLDDLRVVGDGTDEASLLVGKYLTPELWVGYGVGLLNSVNEFLVRYELTSQLSLEASTSEAGSGGDITYTIER